jgi:hypothetical protein
MFLDDIVNPMDMAEAKATKTRLDPKCWKGKHIGTPKTKVKGGVRVNNCVPNESSNNPMAVDSASPVGGKVNEDAWHAGDNAWSSEHDQWAKESQDPVIALTGVSESQQLHVGDPVQIVGDVEFKGKTGEVADIGKDGRFVVVNLYNFGKHSFHSHNVNYNEYADEEDKLDENFGDSPVAGAITRRILMQRLDLLKQYGPESVGAAVDNVADYVGDVDEIGSSDVSAWVAQVERMLKENPPEAFREGWSDAMVSQRTGQPRTPYSVYIKGKKWKDFENDDHAEAVANKLRAKFKAEGKDPSVITIAPTDMSEAISKKDLVGRLQKDLPKVTDPKNKNAQPVAWTGPGKDDYGYTGYQGHGMPTDKAERARIRADKKKGVAETALNPQDPQGDYEAKRKALHDLSLNKNVDQAAVQQRRLDLDREAKAKGVAETITDVKAGMAKIYHKLSPKIERNRDSFLAGQLYDELENYAELHGAEGEFKRMMATARNSAHMEYDTNPGGFHNWFWFLPFEKEQRQEALGESYWTRLQTQRNTKIAGLVNELNKSIEDIK